MRLSTRLARPAPALEALPLALCTRRGARAPWVLLVCSWFVVGFRSLSTPLLCTPSYKQPLPYLSRRRPTDTAAGRCPMRHLHPMTGTQDSKMMNSSTALLDGPGCSCTCSGWWLPDSVASLTTKAALSKTSPGAEAMPSSSSLASSAFRERFGLCSGAVFSVLFRFVPGCCRLRGEQTSRSMCLLSEWAEQKARLHWLQRWFPQTLQSRRRRPCRQIRLPTHSLHLLRCRPC